MFMTIIEEKQLHFCRYPNVRRLRLVWWMCCNLSLLCLLHILVFYKILRMVGGQKTSINVYNMHIIHFCRIGFLQKQILWVDRTYGIRSSLRYIIFADYSLTRLWRVSVTKNHWDKKLMFLWILQKASFTAALLAFVYFAINSACMNEEKNDKESSILFSKMMTNLPPCWIA